MLKLEDVKKNAQIRGIKADEIVRIVQVEPVGDAAITVYYKDSQGKLGEQMYSDQMSLAWYWQRLVVLGHLMRPVQNSS